MVDEQMGITYSIQYLCDNDAVLQHYADNFAPKLQKDVKDRYEGKFNAFRTKLEVVDVLVVNR
jgi:hypothetical protein